MITKKTIYKWFEDFASSHKQIKDFGYGDFSEISMERATTYPLMWVSPQPCSIDGNEITYSYVIAIADRAYKDGSTAIEVESDTFQIGIDLLSAINVEDENWRLNESSTLTPFTENWKDEVDGHLMTLNIIADFDYNECAIPYDGVTPMPNSSCADVMVLVNSVFYQNVPSGGVIDISSPITSGVHFELPAADQYTSYRAGDTGSRVQSGYFPQIVQPAYPTTIAQLDYTNANYWYVLKDALTVNGITNTTRFVDVLGGQSFSSTGNCDFAVLDKLTGNLITRKLADLVSATFNDAIDEALTLSKTINGVVYNDWYLASFSELMSFMGSYAVPTWIDPVTSNTIFANYTGTYQSATTSPYSTTQTLGVNLQASGMLTELTTKAAGYFRIYIHKAHNLIS